MSSQQITILHVDDDPQFGELTKTMIEREDETFDVISETDPHEVEGLLDEHAVDCLVSDYDMPGMDGIELLERIRADDSTLPVILFTGKGTEAVASRAISAGVTDYLQKEGGEDQFAVLANRIHNAVEHRINERKREQYRTVVETAGDAMYVLDEDGDIEIVNEAFERRAGYDREELLGKHVSEFLSPDQVKQGAEAIQSLLQDEDRESERFTFRGPGRDGEERLYETTLSLVNQGGFDGSVGIIRDITEERRQEELLSGLFDESLHGIGVKEIVTDESGEPIDYVYKRVNDRFEELTGLDADEVVGKRATEAIDGIEATPFIDVFGEVALDGTTAQFEQYSEPLDRYYEVSAFSPRHGECISIFSEITERKKREEELIQYKTYVEETSDTIAVVNPDGTIKFHNTGGQSSLSPFNVEGESGFEYIHPNDREQMLDLFTKVLEDGTEEVTTELRVETIDDEWRWIEARGVNKLDDPAIEGIIVSSHDITGRKERQEELERTRNLLRHTQELAGVGGWEVDVETGEQVWTRETYAIHDLDPNGEFNPTVESAIEFYHPEDRPEIDRLVTRCIKKGEPYETTLRLRTAEDRLRWVRTTGVPVREGGSITSIRGAIQDITEQRNYERMLHQIVQRTDELIDETDTTTIAKIAVDIASGVIDTPLAGVHLLTENGECLEGVAANDDVREKIGVPPVYSRSESDMASEIVFQVFDQGEPLYIEDTENYGTLADETPAKSSIIHPLDSHGVLLMSTTEKMRLPILIGILLNWWHSQ
ncbi:PAS domain S-box protein [Halovenus salina]|uniref:histidine kinase n=1 Tax=Halovenus salina TaxID=1510225 RepID=A0ABD5W386_9EURY